MYACRRVLISNFLCIFIFSISITTFQYSDLAFGDKENQSKKAYQWKDANGNTVYGSSPPASAKEIKAFNTRSLSSYSSEKAIRRMEFMSEGVNNEINDNQVHSSSGRLTVGPIEKRNNNGLYDFIVGITNKENKTAFNVRVFFVFPDSNKIQASGKGTLIPNEKSDYILNELLSPLEISGGPDNLESDYTDTESHKNIPLPKLELHYQFE
ncbi:MAG TPA: DUF4124 domain-containing protein [Oligoflexia bacterium]|nr:DUF4124 domain-containing protein [Oligoflexia bacterium]HMP47816.1 DUF4124 domain-containing protein [Oligoflexia bacterium]